VFLKWFWIKVTNIQVISEITKNNFSVTPVGVYSRPRAQLLLSHICISVLASLSNIDCFAILWHYFIVLLIWMTLLYQHLIFSDFNRSWMFSQQCLPIVITLQVLHIIFKWNLGHIIIRRTSKQEQNYFYMWTNVHKSVTMSDNVILSCHPIVAIFIRPWTFYIFISFHLQ